MATSQVWRLKRYGRFVPSSRETGGKPWKTLDGKLELHVLCEDRNAWTVKLHSPYIAVFEANGSKPEIVLTIVESGYLLVLQGQESLDTIPLLCGSDCLKVHQKSDNLMFRFAVKGESRMIRMQFDGRSRAEAVKQCSSAVEKLMEYTSVTTQDDAPPPHNQPPAEVSAPVIQTRQGKAVEAEPEIVQRSLSIKLLTQHFLGETTVALPRVYHHGLLAQGDLEPILRVCLLDPSFYAFVENVEGELRKLLQE